MAETVITLAGVTFNACVTLRDLIKSFEHHTSTIRDLITETEELTEVLRWLSEIAKTSKLDLTVVEYPLKKCEEACVGFKQRLQGFLSSSGETRRTFKGWARFRYHGDDVNTFRLELATYKSIISLGLTGASLQTASLTAKAVEDFEKSVRSTTDDLEERLEVLNERFDSVVQRAVPESDPDAAELRAIEEQRLSTHRCLQICAKMSVYIEQIQIKPSKASRSPSGERYPEPVPEKIMNEGLQEWQDSLRNTTQRLNKHMQYLVSQLVAKSKAGWTSAGDAAELTRLEEEIETNRQFLDMCFQAEKQAKEKITQIDVYASGDDNSQYLVSTDGKVLTGKGRLFGSRTQQFAGHIDGLTLQKLAQPNWRISTQAEGGNTPVPLSGSPPAETAVKDPSDPKFNRYGTGHKLDLVSSPGVTPQEE